MPQQWTPTASDLDQIVAWISAGDSIEKIGPKLGVTGRTVERYLATHPEFKEHVDRARRWRRPPHGTVARYNGWGCRCNDCRAANNARLRASRADRMTRTEQAPHGTSSGYFNWGCRCQPCSKAGREKNAADHLSRLARPEDIPHGTTSGYAGWGCRCDACRAALKAYRKARAT
jgi:hypothetical protein